MTCKRHDFWISDGLRCCLACGETFDAGQEQNSNVPRLQDTPYSYTPLNHQLGQEIRLCILLPGQATDDIALDIVHVNIHDDTDDYPPYEALSYAWATQDGDSSLSQKANCYSGVIPITKACESALRNLRMSKRKRYVWIDAICIDQSNILERNHQVGFMGTIFAKASQVVVHISPCSEATDIMLDHINGETDILKRARDLSTSRHIIGFLRLRWFDRVWILQEIALARLVTMVAGQKTARWTSESINKLLVLCTQLNIEPPSALNWLPASHPERDILSVLQRSRNSSSTDPRDKVFAILGLVSSHVQIGFPIDYSQTIDEVYTRLATYLIHDKRNLEVLKYAGIKVPSLRENRVSPSWVPQWDIKILCEPLPAQFDAEDLRRFGSMWSTQSVQTPHFNREGSDRLLQLFLDYLPKDQQPLSTRSWQRWICRWCTENGMAIASVGPLDTEGTALSLTQIFAPGFHFATVQRDTRSYEHSLTESVSLQAEMLSSSIRSCLRVRAHQLDKIVTSNPRRQPYTFDQSYCDLCSKSGGVPRSYTAKSPRPVCLYEEFIRHVKKVIWPLLISVQIASLSWDYASSRSSWGLHFRLGWR